MNPLVMRLEVAGDAATAAGDHNLAALLWEAAAALALSPEPASSPVLEAHRRAESKKETLCHLEAIPAFAWARMSEFPTGAACGEWWKVSTVPAVGKLWRGEGREVVDLVRRDAISSVMGRL